MDGNLLYIASGLVFRIMDVANPFSPSFRGELQLNEPGGDIKVSGNHAFVISRRQVFDKITNSLQIIDVSNPSAPRLEATYYPSEGNLQAPSSLAVSGNYVFLSYARDAVPSGCIEVLDVSDPAHPGLVAIQPIRSPGRMRIAGHRLYIHGGESLMPGYLNSLNVFDISNPKEIFQVAEYRAFSLSGSGLFNDMAANEQFAFLVGRGFEVTRVEFLPFLGISQNGGKMELNWPNVDPAFQLRQASRLSSPADWISTSLAPATIEGHNYLSLPIESGANFFRLLKP